MTLREQLIQQAETALVATEAVTDDMTTASIAERHLVIVMRDLLAFIKGQEWHGAVYGLNTYTDPETLP